MTPCTMGGHDVSKGQKFFAVEIILDAFFFKQTFKNHIDSSFNDSSFLQ